MDTASAALTESISPHIDETHRALITAAVEATMRRHHIPGLSIAVTTPTGLVFAEGFGYADLARGQHAEGSTQYLWFSLTKIATATAAMHLVDTGALGLDQPVADFIDGYQTRNGEVPTVRHLLSHTAGAANPIPVRWVRPAGQPAPDPDEFLGTLLARHGTAKYAVGGLARYSNLGYLILADVVARASGRPFTEFVTDAVLRPLGMMHTGFDYQDGPRAVGYVRAPRIATPLLRCLLPAGIVGERVGGYTALEPFLVNGPGYGGLVGTVTDAARLAAAHLGDGVLDGHRILTSESACLMREVTASGKPFDLGLGWFRRPTERGTTIVEHLGAGGGFFNAMRLYPERGIGIIAMTNTTRAWDHASLFDAIADLDQLAERVTG